MTQSSLFESGDSATSSSSNESNSFFDWNSEMRAANQNSSFDDGKYCSASGPVEPDYIEFGPGTYKIQRDENGVVTEYTVTNGPEDKVVFTNQDRVVITIEDTGVRQFTYDPVTKGRNHVIETRESQPSEVEQRQEQTNQLAAAFQNFVRALAAFSMYYNRYIQQNHLGGANNGYGQNEPAYFSYDAPTAGPDSAYISGNQANLVARNGRPRTQPPASTSRNSFL